MSTQQISRFIDLFKDFLHKKTMAKITLSNKRDKSADLKNIIVTLVNLKKGLQAKIVYRHNTKDITHIHSLEETPAIIEEALMKDFLNADMYASDENIKLLITPSGKAKIKTTSIQPLKPITLEHNRQKERIIQTDQNIYLRELGIVNANWELRREMTDKYVQINRYIEILEPEIRELVNSGPLNVVDMGSGKGYLTFALYDYLNNILNKPAFISGVEYRDDLVQKSNAIALKAGFENLSFIQGTIQQSDIRKVDILIALHACDTATDDAIFKGITSGASLIVCAPCCQKQVRKESKPSGFLSYMLKHGILLERQSELITDGIRAMILEAWGYKTKVLEFISTEHTPKNLMIVGRKIKDKDLPDQSILQQIKEIRELYGIKSHYLEDLMS